MANPNKNRYGLQEALYVLTFLAILVILFSYVSTGSLFRRSKKISGATAPEIEFELPGTHRKTSLSKLKGSVVLLNFWASWCEPCIREMPSLRMLEAHLKGKGFVLLALNIENESETIRGRLGGSGYPDNLVFNFRKEFLRPYDLNAIPVSVLIDSNGIVRQVYSGPRDWMDINIIREIEALLR